MNVIGLGRATYTGPAGWDEVTPKQFRQAMNWRVTLDSDPAGRIVLLRRWYGIPYSTFDRLNDEQRVDLLALLDFLDARPERWMQPKLHQPGAISPYVGPGDGLADLTFAEFMFAQSARDRYLSSDDPAELGSLLAALYRPRGWSFGQPMRSPFDARLLDTQARQMAKLEMPIKLGVLMNYEGCLDRFPTQFKYLFKPSDGGGDGETWLDVGINLARSTSALGTFAEIERQNLFIVLTTLDAIMKDQEAAKAQQEKWKN